MTSLVPFDFHCVGHLTGISLRCAPLHVCLPATWSSSPDELRLCEEAQQECLTVSKSAATPSPASPIRENVRGGEAAAGAEKTPMPTRGPDSPVRSPTPPPPPPEAERIFSPTSAHPSPHRSRGAVLSAAGAKPYAPRGFPHTVSLHDPSLSLEAFFELRACDDVGLREREEREARSVSVSRSCRRGADKAEQEGERENMKATSAPCAAYTSEVVRGSSHPNWSALPLSALQPYATHTELDVAVFYTEACVRRAWLLEKAQHSPDTPPPPRSAALFAHDTIPSLTSSGRGNVCVLQCRVDVRRSYYLGATVEEADSTLSRLLRFEEQRAPGAPRLPSPVLYLRCVDGVFAPICCFHEWHAPVSAAFEEWQTARTRTFCPAPTAADFQSSSSSPSSLNAIAGRHSLAAVASVQAAAACTELSWSRAPSSVGWRYPDFAVIRTSPQLQQQRLTTGDVKALTHTTLAWQWLVETLEERKAALTRELDASALAHPAVRAVAAQCAATRVRLSAAREAVTLTTLELEEMRERVERRQRRLLHEEEALAAVQLYETQAVASGAVASEREAARDEEAQRAALRAQLARGRQQRVRELCLVYAVTLSLQYANHTCAKAAEAKDHINGAALPILFARRAAADATSHLVASSTDTMHEEAVALGHACHLLIVLSILYSCPLPYPILLAGCHSHVLASPNIDAAHAYAAPYLATGARKYALSCHKVAERPLMMAGVQLLLCDGAVLAKAMGKPERRIAGCADRLGALLDLLLHDDE